MSCDCRTTSQLWDEEARIYAENHLEPLGVRADGLTILHRCPETDIRWLEDYPGREKYGGRLRLRQLISEERTGELDRSKSGPPAPAH
jgi:hypothetical protein